jgi:hypothetical protein
MPNIIIRNYEHVNRSFRNWDTPNGRYIKNKEEYNRAMREEGMITADEMHERVKLNKKGKKYSISAEGQEIINECQKIKNSDGSINLKERPKMVDKMIDHGIIKDRSKYEKNLPKDMKLEGGFDE